MCMPKQEKYERVFVVGLCLFLRRIQLSVDRSLSGDWDDLRSYFENGVRIEDVLEYVAEVSQLENSFDLDSPPEFPRAKWLGWGKRLALSRSELSFMMWWLAKVKSLLEEDQVRLDDVRQTRLQLARCEELIRSRLDRSDRRIRNVEHFNQNTRLECKSIGELIGEEWP